MSASTTVPINILWDLLGANALPMAVWINTREDIKFILSTCSEIDLDESTFNIIMSEALASNVIDRTVIDMFNTEINKLQLPVWGS